MTTVVMVKRHVANTIVNEIDFYSCESNNGVMYICICNAITERQVADSVARGSETLADLQADLGVATNCGCCADTAQEYLPGRRYAAVTGRAAASVPYVEHAANDPTPAFREIIVQRA